MELKMETAVINAFENALAETECPVDGDFLLPDYCADIAAILKCTLTPSVLSRRISGDKLMVDGQSFVRVLYLDEDRKCIHNFECIQPFACAIPIGDTDGALPRVTVKVNYLNCRAVGPRRVDIHGAVTATCAVSKKQDLQVLSDIAGNGVHLRTERMCCSVPCGYAEKNFTIGEVVDLGGSKPPAESILRTACYGTITSVKPMTDKAIVKGEVVLHTLYTVSGAGGNTCLTQHVFPFSQVLEMEDINDTWQCMPHLDVITTDVQITPDQNGQGTLLAVSIKLCARLDACCRVETAVVTDAYTSKYPTATSQKRFLVEEQLFCKQDTATLKEVLELPSESTAEIVDLWCEVTSVSTRRDETCTYADGHLQFCMPVRDRDGMITYYEHVSDFSLQFEDVCDRMAVEVQLCSLEYAVIGGKLEIRLELSVCRTGYRVRECVALQQFEPTAEPYAEERAALRICRVPAGSSVWEIAKCCHTDIRAVMEENGLDDDCVREDRMLMIPLC